MSATGHAPSTLPSAAASLTNDGNPLGEARDERTAWAEGLTVKPYTEGMEILYFVGCYYSYDPRMQKVAVATAKILQRAGVEIKRRLRDILVQQDMVKVKADEIGLEVELAAKAQLEQARAQGAAEGLAQGRGDQVDSLLGPENAATEEVSTHIGIEVTAQDVDGLGPVSNRLPVNLEAKTAHLCRSDANVHKGHRESGHITVVVVLDDHLHEWPDGGRRLLAHRGRFLQRRIECDDGDEDADDREDRLPHRHSDEQALGTRHARRAAFFNGTFLAGFGFLVSQQRSPGIGYVNESYRKTVRCMAAILNRAFVVSEEKRGVTTSD